MVASIRLQEGGPRLDRFAADGRVVKIALAWQTILKLFAYAYFLNPRPGGDVKFVSFLFVIFFAVLRQARLKAKDWC